MGKLVDSLVIIGSLWTKWVLIASPPLPPVSPPPGADVSVSCSVDLKPGASAVKTAARAQITADCSIQITAGPAHTELSLQFIVGR